MKGRTQASPSELPPYVWVTALKQANHSIRLWLKAIPKSYGSETAIAPLGQVTGCCEPTLTAMDLGQYTPTDDLAPQLCHSFTFFCKHILLQLDLNKVINAAPQGLCFPSAGYI